MYRQVLLNEQQTSLQRILWRDDESKEIKTFELTTVTYGTASASYLAVKVSQQVAIEERQTLPKGAEVVLRDLYVDDLLTGANTWSEAETIRDQVINILSGAGFELRKWASNHQGLLADIPSTLEFSILDLGKNDSIKTLGPLWNSKTDTLQYSAVPTASSKRITKRTILAAISRIFDPLGIIGPILITAKILMQELRTLNIGLDESVPIEIHNKWVQYERELNTLSNIKIPRNAVELENPKALEIHGFCDASEGAYGACIYVRTIDIQGSISYNLLCAKSRVAPLKSVSLPRLELCGALLLAHTTSKVMEAMPMPHKISRIYYWSDSTIVLAWIRSPSRNWKTFVANRISEIQELTNANDWNHISTNDADVISRGIAPSILQQCSLWWKGPLWLQQESARWPRPLEISGVCEIPEQKMSVVAASTFQSDLSLFTKYSDFIRLVRIVAYCLRFKNNICARIKKNVRSPHVGPMNASDIRSATNAVIRNVQSSSFTKKLIQLRKRGSVDAKSNLLCLNPFIDDENLLRVGGRLRNASLPYDQRHQILLPSQHPLTELIIAHEHRKQLHAGTQATIAAVRSKYWSMSARNTVKAAIRKCVICYRANPSRIQHIMSDLPADRTKQSCPFENVGIDYFGPVYIREGVRRSKRIKKAYGAVFVCFATKAVHIELVGDLTTDAFIGALRRFMNRRGRPANIHSDNGTQFVGANRELKELHKLFQSSSNQERICNAMSQDGINWHFIPPRSLQFGGMWEAAVKSFKYHLTRIVSNASLNYEELYTIFVQIEGILNSRPITPLSNDPNDLSFLTPAHFLLADPISAAAEPSLLHLKVNSLSRWQYLQQVREHFWRRWSQEYLSQFQSRNKWKSNARPQLQQGMLVLLRDDQLPPMQWPIGRITEVFPGSGGVVRTAMVKTPRGVTRRAAAKLCILPMDSVNV